MEGHEVKRGTVVKCAAQANTTRGALGHGPPENFENYEARNCSNDIFGTFKP